MTQALNQWHTSGAIHGVPASGGRVAPRPGDMPVGPNLVESTPDFPAILVVKEGTTGRCTAGLAGECVAGPFRSARPCAAASGKRLRSLLTDSQQC